MKWPCIFGIDNTVMRGWVDEINLKIYRYFHFILVSHFYFVESSHQHDCQMFAALLTASGLGVSELSNNENVPSHWILRPDCSFLTVY